jgi:hypothetical protein
MAVGGYIRSVWRTPFDRRRLAALALATVAAVVLAGCGYGNDGRPACADSVLDAWTKGTLDATYSPGCYDAAIDALPEDLRAYTTAADDIARVAIAATRSPASSRQVADAGGESDPGAFPTEVVLLVGLLLVTGACGLGAALLRRRRRA